MSLLRAKAETPKDYFSNKRRFITFNWKRICYSCNCVCVSWKGDGPGCGLQGCWAAPSDSWTSHRSSVLVDLASNLQSPGKSEVMVPLVRWHIYLAALTLAAPTSSFMADSASIALLSLSTWTVIPPGPGKVVEDRKANSWLHFRQQRKSGTGCPCYGLNCVLPKSACWNPNPQRDSCGDRVFRR